MLQQGHWENIKIITPFAESGLLRSIPKLGILSNVLPVIIVQTANAFLSATEVHDSFLGLDNTSLFAVLHPKQPAYFAYWLLFSGC